MFDRIKPFKPQDLILVATMIASLTSGTICAILIPSLSLTAPSVIAILYSVGFSALVYKFLGGIPQDTVWPILRYRVTGSLGALLFSSFVLTFLIQNTTLSKHSHAVNIEGWPVSMSSCASGPPCTVVWRRTFGCGEPTRVFERQKTNAVELRLEHSSVEHKPAMLCVDHKIAEKSLANQTAPGMKVLRESPASDLLGEIDVGRLLAANLTPRPIVCKFRIGDLPPIGTPLELTYKQEKDDPATARLFREDGTQIEPDCREQAVQIVRESSNNHSWGLLDVLFPTALAQSQRVSPSDLRWALTQGSSLEQEEIAQQLGQLPQLEAAAILNHVLENSQELPPEERTFLGHNAVQILAAIELPVRVLSVKARLLLGLSLFASNDYVEAARVLDTFGNNLPEEYSALYFFRGFSRIRSEKDPGSLPEEKILDGIKDLRQFEERTKSDYNRAVALANIGYAYRKLARNPEGAGREEHLEQAVKSYELSIRADSKYPNSYNNLAYLYAEEMSDDRHRLLMALKLVQKALELSPEEPAFLDTKGWVLSKLGRYSEADIFLKKALAKAGDDDEIKEHLKANDRKANEPSSQ